MFGRVWETDCRVGNFWGYKSVIINKISASELSRKLIKSALLVGQLQLLGYFYS